MTRAAYRERLYSRYRSDKGWSEGFDDRAPRLGALARTIRRHFPSDRSSRILDLGCGSGTLVGYLRSVGYREVAGVDAAAEQIEAAARAGIGGLAHEDLMSYLRRSPRGALDVVVAWDVIEHLDKTELLGLLDEVHRVLAPGGYAVIHAPNAESPFGSRIRYADLTHELAFTRESLGQVLRACGFDGVSFHEDDPAVHGAKSALRWVLWKLIRGLLRVYVAAETGSTGRDGVFTQNLIAIARRP